MTTQLLSLIYYGKLIVRESLYLMLIFMTGPGTLGRATCAACREGKRTDDNNKSSNLPFFQKNFHSSVVISWFRSAATAGFSRTIEMTLKHQSPLTQRKPIKCRTSATSSIYLPPPEALNLCSTIFRKDAGIFESDESPCREKPSVGVFFQSH